MQDSGAQAPSPITAGLRDIMRHDYQHDALVVDEKVFIDMCDAIDSVHMKCETTLADAIREGHEWVDSYERLKRERDAIVAELDRLQGEFDHDGWTELPRDADGVPIHVGDVMDFSENVRGLTVLGVGTVDEAEDEWGVFVRESGEYVWYNADFLRHHHAPTVEDVLRECCVRYHSLLVESMSDVTHEMPAPSEAIAEYAAKLREVMGDE